MKYSIYTLKIVDEVLIHIFQLSGTCADCFDHHTFYIFNGYHPIEGICYDVKTTKCSCVTYLNVF